MDSRNRRTNLTEFISKRMSEIGKTHDDVARDLGFAKSNTVSMILNGKIKLPFDRIRALAIALAVDPPDLLRLVLRDYDGGLLNAIEGTLQRPLITACEAAATASSGCCRQPKF